MALSYFILGIETLILFIFKLFIAKEGADILSVVFILVFSLFFLIDLRCNKKKCMFFSPILIMYIIRISLLFFDYFGRNIFLLPMSGGDELAFYLNAIKFANKQSVTYGGLLSKMMGLIARFVGENKLWLQFILVLISIASVFVLIDLFKYVDISSNVQTKTVWIVCLLPYSSLIHCHFGRESIIAFLTLLSVYSLILWMRSGNIFKLITSLFLAFIPTMFHSGMVGIFLAYFVMMLFYDVNKEQFVFGKINIIATFLMIVFFLILLKNKELFLGKMQHLKSILDIAKTSARGGSSYAKYVGNSNSVKNIIIYTIPRLLYFVFSPFPWQWRGIGDILAFSSSSVFYGFVFVNTVKYFTSSKKKNKAIIILLSFIILITYFIFSWGTDNTGTALRHRDKLVLLQVLLLACELDL